MSTITIKHLIILLIFLSANAFASEGEDPQKKYKDCMGGFPSGGHKCLSSYHFRNSWGKEKDCKRIFVEVCLQTAPTWGWWGLKQCTAKTLKRGQSINIDFKEVRPGVDRSGYNCQSWVYYAESNPSVEN